jgi:hypothetical protein
MEEPGSRGGKIIRKSETDPERDVRGFISVKGKAVMALRPCSNDFGKASLKRAKGGPGRATMMSQAETTNFCESMKLKFKGHGERCPAFIVVLSRARALRQRMFHGCGKGRGEVMKVLTQNRGSEWRRDVRRSRKGVMKEF